LRIEATVRGSGQESIPERLMTSPIERVAALTVGTVESVSPDEIRVILDVDAPQTVALNAGTPAGFPRVNGYVLIPNEAGAVVGLIVFLGVERSPFPKRTGLKDFGLIDLPFPLRKLHVTPVGTLRFRQSELGGVYDLARGVASFPSVGDPVLIPTIEQLTAIVEAGGEDGRLRIGSSPLAANARVFVDPDELFGRHLAVLGNTGSGKSCSVAGLIRWSIEAASESRERTGRGGAVNARFIVLDPNGEYLKTFADLPFKPRVFQVPPPEAGNEALAVPAWMWNSSEWAAFAQAAPGVQRPLLLEALRAMRGGSSVAPSVERRIGTVLRGRLMQFRALAQSVAGYTGFPARNNAGENIEQTAADLEQYVDDASAELSESLQSAIEGLREVAKERRWTSRDGKSGFNDFGETHLKQVEKLLQEVADVLSPEVFASTYSEDAPIKFDVAALPDLLDTIGRRKGGGNAQFVANLSMRIRMLLADHRLRAIVVPEEEPTVVGWLESFIGQSNAENGQIAVIDLSLVPAEIIHIVIAVLARLSFEAVQRYRKLRREEIPTVLVLEEAHTFVHRERQNVVELVATPAQMCRATFERIAREGRKFGLGLLLSSQRPSELSETVLAQCNTFLLHRIVNDRDQELVARLVPDNVRGILRELPSLPAGQAILLGWAAAIPVLVDMRHLPKDQQPHSSDPEYWNVWTGAKPRPISWEDIYDDWVT
jgi:DNA helicase HerA-like ATPase